MTDENVDDVTDTTDESRVSKQNVLGSEFDIRDPFYLEGSVHLWEQMTEEVIDNRIQQLETADVQCRAALEKLEANGGKGNEDWMQLDARKNEIARQLEHTKANIVPGDLVFKAKTKCLIEIRVGSEWNNSLERHVVVEGGFVTRMLPKAPI